MRMRIGDSRRASRSVQRLCYGAEAMGSIAWQRRVIGKVDGLRESMVKWHRPLAFRWRGECSTGDVRNAKCEVRGANYFNFSA
jgi:hypothetical protein